MGWHRANLVYDKAEEPPEPGSLKEAACILVQRYRWEQEYYKTCVLAVHGDNPEAKKKFMAEYRAALLPCLRDIEENVDTQMRRLMNSAFGHGPIGIRRDK